MADEFNVQRAKDLETLYQANQLPADMRKDYELVRPGLQEKLEDTERTLPSALGEAVTNLPSSAIKAGTDIAHAVVHPIETGKALGKIGAGLAQQATGGKLGESYEDYAKAFEKDFITDRYGSWEKFKKALAKDPVGIISDASMFLGGAGVAARTAEIAATGSRTAGPVSRALKTASKYTNPGSLAAPVARGAGNVAAEAAGIFTGAEPIKEAARAGYEAGAIRPAAESLGIVSPSAATEASRTFLRHITGDALTDEPVAAARRAVDILSRRKNTKFERDLAPVLRDPTILSWNDVDTALADADRVQSFRGYDWGAATREVRDRMRAEINRWKNGRASQWSTIEGFHALKQNLGQILESTEPRTPAHMVANNIYNAVRDTAVKQNPRYGRIMKEYEAAFKQIKELERELSIGSTATVSTGLRKLLASMRNNVHANFSRRQDLVQLVQEAGAPHLLAMLAGQSLKGFEPRGAGRLAVGLELLGGEPTVRSLGVMATQVPHWAGRGAHVVGKAAKSARNLYPPFWSPQATYQAGRLSQDTEGNPYYEPLENAPEVGDIPQVVVHPER